MPYKTLKCPKFDIPPTEGSTLSVQASPEPLHTTQNKLGLREMMQMLTVVLLLLLQ